jgi:hypothetical protein
MLKITSESGLRNAILQLERKQDEDGRLVREQFDLTVRSFKPINLIKSTFNNVAVSGDAKNSILNTSAGMAAGLVAKMAIGLVTKGPLTKILGTLAMIGITKVVAKHPGTVRLLGLSVLGLFRNKSNVKGNSRIIANKKV